MIGSESMIEMDQSYSSTNVSSADVLEMDDDSFITMQYTEQGQKSKAAMNTIIELGKLLLQAAREGDTLSVIDLMGKGAPFTTDWLGTSPLHLAAINNHLETCDTLLKAGIGKDAKTKVDKTPLHFAAYEGHTDIVRLLLKHNAEVDCRDMLHMTPLHWAVERHHWEAATLLVRAGADPSAVSRFHKTPRSIALSMGWGEMVTLLQQADANRTSNTTAYDTEQAVETITDELLTNEDIVVESDMAEEDTHIEDMESEQSQEHIESILPKVSHNSNEAAVQMLREHGIVMLPTDTSNTITTAVQSGRKIVLSDAGKLMLKDINMSKCVEVKKKPVVLPLSKAKNTKIYTMTNSQFLAIAGQNKSITKIPINLNKLDQSPGKFKTLPVLKAINLDKSPAKVTSGGKIVSPYKGKIISLNSLTKVPGNLSEELMNVKTLASQGKAKIIQLKNAASLGKTVKIVVKNNANNNIFKTESNASVKLNSKDLEALTTNAKLIDVPDLLDMETMETSTSSAVAHNENTARDQEMEELRRELAETKRELDEYKRKFQEMGSELNCLKSRQFVINTVEVENELENEIHHSEFVLTT